MTERILTPSSITAWLDCDHYLTLRHEVEDGLRERPNGGLGSFARLIMDKGLEHEAACLAEYERQGKSIFRVPERHKGESFVDWVARVGDPLAGDWDVVYQMPFVQNGIRGIADFLVRVIDDDGVASYEPVDAKLARNEAKPGHVLQLCFYAEAIEASTGRRPRRMHLWLGSGAFESLWVEDFGGYWRRLRSQLAAVLDVSSTVVESRPEQCEHCKFCEFSNVCDAQWRADDSLIYVARIRSRDIAHLEADGVTTLEDLASLTKQVVGLRPENQSRIQTQARLQRNERDNPSQTPPFEIIEPGDDHVWGHGFDLLPAPHEGDVFLDFEGHPFWRADRDLFFLFGLIAQDASGSWKYQTWWAHSPEEEAAAALALIEYLTERRNTHSDMHVYHYNHTERSSLERLAETYGVGELALARLIDDGVFVDLMDVARNAIQVGTESYGLKHLEKLTDYERGADIGEGAGAVLEYERYMAEGAAVALERIASYNEDDVRATRALRDWMLDHRPHDLPWRPALLEPDNNRPELDEQVERLHAFGPSTIEHLLGDVLGYWRREWLAHLAPLLVKCESEVDDFLEDPEVLAGLEYVGEFTRIGKKGNPLPQPALRYTMPEQECSLTDGNNLIFTTAEGCVEYATVDRIDSLSKEVDLTFSNDKTKLGVKSSVFVHNDWFNPKPKPEAVSMLAASVLDPSAGPPRPAAMALLRRDLPTFVNGFGPIDGVFTDDLDQMLAWATGLNQTVVAIQGPPGTGKTFRGARFVRELVLAGKRVGITAMSHNAIDNLLEEVVHAFAEAGDLDRLNAFRKRKKPDSPLERVKYKDNNEAAAKDGYNLVAGTTWLFANDAMLNNPVDVLIIDEAGQLALADALAVTRSAHNLVLLGDPLQLAQVTKAAHPNDSGRSVLEHVLGDHVTMPPDRGVFLAETRRMHPDVSSFISDQIYEGRLTSHSSCAVQNTAFGTGLRWIRAEHVGRSTDSEEEAEIIQQEILRLLGTPWTDRHGNQAPLTANDILVVAPYKDQVNLLKSKLEDDLQTREVAIGTVDKFQGREAAVVFFTMAASTGENLRRGAEFLFSRERFNVAISRARCLAYLVCTDQLLNSRGKNIEEMRLISTICSFAERATIVSVQPVT